MSAECSLYLGVAHLGIKNPTQARPELESAVTKSERLGARALIARSHHFLGEALRLTGNQSDAATHYAKTKQLSRR